MTDRWYWLAAMLAVVLVASGAADSIGAQPAPLERRIDSIFSAVNSTASPGCSVGADRNGQPLFRRAYGIANLETATPFSVTTISESGSTAKQFVAASLVLLALDGTLSLDDDVAKWVPEVKGVGKRISVRQLLSHTSGLPDRYTLHDVEGRPAGETDHPNAEVLDIVSHLRELNFDPGEDYLYSNTGYIVAVAVLERASGKSLDAFTHERIFAPLGMTSTRWRQDHRVVVAGRASAYSGTIATGFRNDHPFTRVFGSGGLLLTVDDMLRWSAAMQNGTGHWAAVRDSMSAVIHLNDGTGITYGLGVSTDIWRGVKRVSHTGATGGYRAALYRFPDQKASVAMFCNLGSVNLSGLLSGTVTAVLGDALIPATADTATTIAATPEALAAFAGRYFAPRTEELVILQARNGQLVDSLSDIVYLPVSADRFRGKGSATELLFSRTGESVTMRRSSPASRAVDYARVAAPNASKAVLASLVGVYASPELGARTTLVAHGDSLLIDLGWRGLRALTPLFLDGFSSDGDGSRYRFTRDRSGHVTGFVIWADRVRHLRFERQVAR